MYGRNIVKYFIKSLVTLIKISRDYVFGFLKGVNSSEIFTVLWLCLRGNINIYQSAK